MLAALKRHEFCRRLGGGNVMKGLHRLLLAERRAERLLDREGPPPRPARGRHAAAAPTRAPAAAGAGLTKEAAPRRRKPASDVRKARSAARLQEFLAAKQGARHHLHTVLQRWRRQHGAEGSGECEPLLALQGEGAANVAGAKRACDAVAPSEPRGTSPSHAVVVREGDTPPPSEAATRGQPIPANPPRRQLLSASAPPPAAAKRKRSPRPPSQPARPPARDDGLLALARRLASRPHPGSARPPGLT